MNHKIQELAKQAKESVPPSLGVNQWIERYNELLALLIIKECATIADTERPNTVGCGYITKTRGMLIREHFGVGE
jgi:hypothetical protein